MNAGGEETNSKFEVRNSKVDQPPAFSLPDQTEIALKLALNYGPKAINSDTPAQALREIARSPRFARLKDAALKLNAGRAAAMKRRLQIIGQEIRKRTFKASDGLAGVCQLKVDAEHFIKTARQAGIAQENAFHDQHFIEWYQQNFPYCRVRTTHGTKGQEYAGDRKAKR